MTGVVSYGDFFRGTPFGITASPETAACWAGRPDVKAKLDKMCRSYASRPDSSLDMIWANLGAGKSHALFHMQISLGAYFTDMKPVCLYLEMQQQPKSFLDLYRQLTAQFDLGEIVPHILRADGKCDDNLLRAARALAHGGEDQRHLAAEWLTGGRPHLKDLRMATGIGARIEDDLHASSMLSLLVGILAAQGVRTIVLIDEFQRIASSSAKQREAILQNIRSVFSRNPAYLSVVLAATSRMEKTALDLLPQELRTLMGSRPTISLPKMAEDEAFQFLAERIRYFRPSGYMKGDFAPVGEVALRSIVSFVGRNADDLIPRKLLQTASWVCDGAILSGVDELSGPECDRLLAELRPQA